MIWSMGLSNGAWKDGFLEYCWGMDCLDGLLLREGRYGKGMSISLSISPIYMFILNYKATLININA